MKSTKGAGAFILAFAVLSSCAGADELSDRVDSLFAGLNSTHTPGVVAAAIKGDQFLYKKAFGMAHLELGVPNTVQTVFRIGSVSKQFTAACIALLIIEGKLSLDDTLTHFFPELPEAVYGKVTVDHMIHHTSGIRDSESMYPLMGIDYAQWFTHDMLLTLLARQKALDFDPGDSFEYSNSTYTLLASIVEKVSGQRFDQFVAERVFQHLGMAHTKVCTGPSTFIPRRAAGYASAEVGYTNWMTNNQLVGHDAVYSSVEDLYFWIQAFFDDRLGTGLIETMTQPTRLNDGSLLDYGYGMVVRPYKGLRMYFHGGWYVGYTGALAIFPDQDFAVIVLSNLGDYNPTSPCLQIADLFLAEAIKAALSQEPYRETIENTLFTKEVLEKLSGEYISLHRGGVARFDAVDDPPRLRLDETDYIYEPSPYATNELINHAGLIGLRFYPETVDTDLPTFEVHFYGIEDVCQKYIRKEYDQELSEFAGRFWSDELGIRATITTQDTALVIELGHYKAVLNPIDKDTFAESKKIRYTRDETGRITGFLFDSFGARNLLFVKEDSEDRTKQ